jgi:formate-dependent nitrite reductase cytochrome c552 subunit
MIQLYALAASLLLAQGPTAQQTNDRIVNDFMARIAGHEMDPAERVFKNVQWLKGVPAGTFLEIMNTGYSKALGLTCAHCHVETDFASDEKRPKKAAREMQVLHRSINEQLRKLQYLAIDPDKRSINCAACHRGFIDPRTAGR